MFIGNKYFFLTNMDDGFTYHGFFFQFAFAATAATIVSGAVAERCAMISYLCYSLFLTTWVYPVVVHWGWSGRGWLSAWKGDDYRDELLLDIGMVDFAGCGVVHMVGGLSGLIGAKVLGPRQGRFGPVIEIPGQPKKNIGPPIDIPGHSATLQVLGTFILWVGWYGFNPGSTLALDGLSGVASKTAVTTTLSACAGAATGLVIFKLKDRQYDLSMTLNGALAGLVSVTASCSVIEPWAAIVIGIVGACVYVGSSMLVLKVGIDDVVDAGPVHYFCGMWGLIASGLFCTKENLHAAYYDNLEDYGLFYGGGIKLLAVQIIAVFAISAWVFAMMFPFFLGLNAAGLLRVTLEEEQAGMDVSKHGGSAYEMVEVVMTSPTKNVEATNGVGKPPATSEAAKPADLTQQAGHENKATSAEKEELDIKES